MAVQARHSKFNSPASGCQSSHLVLLHIKVRQDVLTFILLHDNARKGGKSFSCCFHTEDGVRRGKRKL